MLAALAALLLAARPDPCAPVEPAAAPDPATAADYRAVAEAERRAGNRDGATAALRSAAALDPEDRRAGAALQALCREARAASAFDRGVALVDRGDRRAAVAAFEEARAAGPDPSATLLEAISLYELGDDARALPLLDEAERDPDHADAARFFRGLVALRGGRSEEAARLLEASAADRHLAPLALGLARLARRDGRVVLAFLAESGWDSNVDLTPSGAPGVTDESAGLTAVARVAPMGDTGPFVAAAAHVRNQVHYDALDIAGFGTTAGVQAGRGRQFLLAQWTYEYRDLGGAPYLSANGFLGEARLALGQHATAGVSWLGRLESFRQDADAPYSGFRQLAEADLTFETTPRSTLALGWRGGLDSARDPSLSYWETGPHAVLRVALSPSVRLGVDVALAVREYRTVDLALGVARSDVLLDGAALLEWDLADRWTLRLSAAGRKASSNVPELAYTKLAPMIGLAYTVGLL